MRTHLGIYNPNSKYNRSLRTAHVPSKPAPASAEVGLFVICEAYRDAENWTAWYAMNGQPEAAEKARQTAARFRAQLRTLLAKFVIPQ